jgi:hypothetical protein
VPSLAGRAGEHVGVIGPERRTVRLAAGVEGFGRLPARLLLPLARWRFVLFCRGRTNGNGATGAKSSSSSDSILSG